MLNLIDRLPQDSNYWEAVSQDEELALAYLEREEAGDVDDGEDVTGSTAPRMRTWSPTVAGLATIADYVQQLIHVEVQAAGGKPGRHHPQPRPSTALGRLRTERRVATVQALDAMLVESE